MDIKNLSSSMVFNEKTFTKRILYKDEYVLSFILNFKLGQALPPHKHEKSTILLFVLSGSAEIRINNDVEHVEEGDFITIKGEDDLEITKVKEDTSIFVTISPLPSNEVYAKERG